MGSRFPIPVIRKCAQFAIDYWRSDTPSPITYPSSLSHRISFCDACGHKCNSKFGVQYHVRRIHLKSGAHRPSSFCDICLKEYVGRNGLTKHLVKKHGLAQLPEMPRLACDYCQYLVPLSSGIYSVIARDVRRRYDEVSLVCKRILLPVCWSDYVRTRSTPDAPMISMLMPCLLLEGPSGSQSMAGWPEEKSMCLHLSSAREMVFFQPTTKGPCGKGIGGKIGSISTSGHQKSSSANASSPVDAIRRRRCCEMSCCLQ